MMDIYNSLAGCIRVELTSADVSGTIREINAAGIGISDIEIIDHLTVCFTLSRRNLKFIRTLTNRKGERLSVVRQMGIFWRLRNIRNRHILLSGLVLVLLMTLFIPSRILFVQIEGNVKIPEKEIIEAAKIAGVGFFTVRRNIRSENVKNILLDALPELQWAGVNTYGCKAVISVRERSDTERLQTKSDSTSIVACREGIITSCTVTNGSAKCTIGQTVQKGEILISGCTDYSGVAISGRAEGEVFASTIHEIRGIAPAQMQVRRENGKAKAKFILCIGKKRINLYKGSGISAGSCGKMVSQYKLALPGGYVLPITLIKETFTPYVLQNTQIESDVIREMLSRSVQAYLRQEGVALSIVDHNESFSANEAFSGLVGIYNCVEMIGREQAEQIGDIHGKTN